MENASKALIIAGSILLSILIIALGMYIFSTSSSTADVEILNEDTEPSLATNVTVSPFLMLPLFTLPIPKRPI